MKSETLFNIVQFIRTLLPIFAAIGTISSAVGILADIQKMEQAGHPLFDPVCQRLDIRKRQQ